MSAVADELGLCGVEEKEWTRWAFCRITRFGVESAPILANRAGQARFVRDTSHIRHAQTRRIQGNTASFLSFSFSAQERLY